MDWLPADRRTRLRAASGLILLAGLAAAAVLYGAAGDEPGDVLGYQETDGGYAPVRPEDSKKYLRQMEAVGGKANVLAWELRQWFEGLWRGRSLACTVGVLAAVLALGVYLAADRPPGSGRDSRDDPGNP